MKSEVVKLKEDLLRFEIQFQDILKKFPEYTPTKEFQNILSSKEPEKNQSK